MDDRLSPAKQLSFALQYLHRVVVEKGAAIEELQANNQELEAALEGIFAIHGELKDVDGHDGLSGPPIFHKPLLEPRHLDFSQLKLEADLVLKKAQAVVQESNRLRMRSKQMRAALVLPVNVHAKADGHTGVRGNSGVDGNSETLQPRFEALSKREQQVLALIVAGKSSRHIAGEMGISFKTVVTHRASIMNKMGVHEIASVVREAIRRGLA